MWRFDDLLLFGFALALLIGFWATSLRARERALEACRRICDECDMQLLDYTVALTAMWPARDSGGRLVLRRRYGFEFSPDGHTRYTGRLYLLGNQLQSAQLDMPDGTTLVSATGRRLPR